MDAVPNRFKQSDAEIAQSKADYDLLAASIELLPEHVQPSALAYREEAGEVKLSFDTPETARAFRAGLAAVCERSPCNYKNAQLCSSVAMFSLGLDQKSITTGQISALARLVQGLTEVKHPGMTSAAEADVNIAHAFLEGVKNHQKEGLQR